MEIRFNNKLLSSVDVRVINVELMILHRDGKIPLGAMNDEKMVFKILFDEVASKGYKGAVHSLLKLDPGLKDQVELKFREHIVAGNAINVDNYLSCFSGLPISRELINIANAKLRMYPQSSDRQKIAELLKVKAARRE